MPLIVKKITREPEKDEKYGNWSYWAEFEGIDGGVLVSHKGHIDPLKPGDDALAAGFERVDDVPKKNGSGSYKKLMRPEKQFGGGGGGKSYGKSKEELADARANSALIRAYEYYQLSTQHGAAAPSLTDFLKTAQTIHTALGRLAGGEGK